MTRFGQITAVTQEPVGTTLAATASAGDSSIVVDDITQLTWPSGVLYLDDGVNRSEGIAYTVPVAPDPNIDVVNSDEDDDVDESTVDLLDIVPDDFAVDTPVLQYPQTTEKLATVRLHDQAEELVLRVPQHLTDRLPTGIRDDPQSPGSSESVEIIQSEPDYMIVDMVDELGTGFSRGYDAPPPVPVTSTNPASPDVIATVTLDVPSSQHRVIGIWGATLSGSLSDVFVDDDSFDIAPGDRSWGASSRGQVLAVYAGIAVPTPGLHTFRLTAIVAAGSVTSNTSFWLVAI